MQIEPLRIDLSVAISRPFCFFVRQTHVGAHGKKYLIALDSSLNIGVIFDFKTKNASYSRHLFALDSILEYLCDLSEL